MLNEIIKMADLFLSFWKKFIESKDKMEFIKKHNSTIKNFAIIILSLTLILIIFLYFFSKQKIIPIKTNSPIVIKLEVPSDISAPVTLQILPNK